MQMELTDPRSEFVAELTRRFGEVRRLAGSRSLLALPEDKALLYLRYSRLHAGGSTFYGLREQDINRLRGLNSFLVFLWDGQDEPLIMPIDKFLPVIDASPVAGDGQIKVQIHVRPVGTEFYAARAGRHNVEAYRGWWPLLESLSVAVAPAPLLGHSDVQSLLGSIGSQLGMDVWIPPSDRGRLNWELVEPFEIRQTLPNVQSAAARYLPQIDVIWLRRGSGDLEALYEIEHSTPIYSGLLRLNDIKCEPPGANRYAIVANTSRRDLFSIHLARPTFRASGLSEVCGFLQYTDVYRWRQRLISQAIQPGLGTTLSIAP